MCVCHYTVRQNHVHLDTIRTRISLASHHSLAKRSWHYAKKNSWIPPHRHFGDTPSHLQNHLFQNRATLSLLCFLPMTPLSSLTPITSQSSSSQLLLQVFRMILWTQESGGSDHEPRNFSYLPCSPINLLLALLAMCVYVWWTKLSRTYPPWKPKFRGKILLSMEKSGIWNETESLQVVSHDCS